MDWMFLVPMGINIVHNEVRLYHNKLDDRHRQIQLKFLSKSPEEWSGSFQFAKETEETVSINGPSVNFGYYQTEIFNHTGIKDFVTGLQENCKTEVVYIRRVLKRKKKRVPVE